MERITTSKNESIDIIKKKIEWYESFPRPFHGILSNINMKTVKDEKIFELYKTTGIYKEYDYYSKKKDYSNLTKKELFYKTYDLNPILYYEYLSYIYVYILYEVYEKLERFNIETQNQLKFQLNLNDKINFIKTIKKKLLKKTKKKDNLILFSLYYSQYQREELLLQNWLDALNYTIEITPYSLETELNSQYLDYLTSKEPDSPNPYHLDKFHTWLKFELLINKLELIKNIEENLTKLTNLEFNKENIKGSLLKLSKNDQTFIEGLKQILENESDSIIFIRILKLNEEKNIPFFTALFSFFGGQEGKETKYFVDDKPKNFIKIVNHSYNLNMKRLINETGSRPNRLKQLFRKEITRNID